MSMQCSWLTYGDGSTSPKVDVWWWTVRASCSVHSPWGGGGTGTRADHNALPLWEGPGKRIHWCLVAVWWRRYGLHYTFLLMLCYDHPKVRQPCAVLWCKASVCVFVLMFLLLSFHPGLALLLPYLISQNKHWKNCKLRIFTGGSSRQVNKARLRCAVGNTLWTNISVMWHLRYNWPNGILGNLWCYKCCTEYLLSGISLFQITIYTQIQPSHALTDSNVTVILIALQNDISTPEVQNQLLYCHWGHWNRQEAFTRKVHTAIKMMDYVSAT